MPTEEELRARRCSFTGHRPEKLYESEETVRAWLEKQIRAAIADGFTTFISGMAMGVDLWAAELVLRIREENPDIHLICAAPWVGFAAGWRAEWKNRYDDIKNRADIFRTVSPGYHGGVFQLRNEWMVDHSSRVIAYYNGSPGGTKNMLDYAERKGIETVVWISENENEKR